MSLKFADGGPEMSRTGVETKTELGLGRTVARLLGESGKRQVDLCDFSHWSRAYVSYICTERRKWPSFDKAKIIADFFGLTMDQLWAEHLLDLQESGIELSDDDRAALERHRVPFRFVEKEPFLQESLVPVAAETVSLKQVSGETTC